MAWPTSILILSFSCLRKLYKFCNTCGYFDHQDRMKTDHSNTDHKFKATKDLGFLKVGYSPETNLEDVVMKLRLLGCNAITPYPPNKR